MEDFDSVKFSNEHSLFYSEYFNDTNFCELDSDIFSSY